ncbi:MAG: ABC transporter permease [Candidatus Polarisedimenticolia bacterium]
MTPGARTWRLLVAILVGWLCLLPVIQMVLLGSAGPWPPGRLLPESLQWSRWARALSHQGDLPASVLVSLLISGCVAVLSTAIGFAASRQIAGHRRERALLFASYLPFAISPVILATCLLYVYIKLGLSGSLHGVILSQTTVASGFATVFLHGMWNPRQRGLEEVARTLGAKPLQSWIRVLLPASAPLLRVCFIQTFLISWAQYGLTLMIGSGKVRTLPLRVFDYLFEADPGYAAVAGVMLVAPPILLLWMERRLLLRTPW